MIKLESVTKIYKSGKKEVYGVKGINLIVDKSEFVVVIGPSGCGKTTLLNLIGGIDTPSKGKIIVDGEKVELSTPFGTGKTKVSGIAQELGSSEGYIFKDLTSFSGALLKVSSGNEKQIEKSLRNLSFIKSWVTKGELKHSWFHLMSLFLSFVYTMDIVTLVLVLITMGVFAFLSTKEREWEFTILKAMGYSNLEILLLSLIGVLLDVPLSMHLATLFNRQFEAVMSGPSAVFISDVIIIRSLVIVGSSLLTMFLVTKSRFRTQCCRTAEKSI